jgi:RNA polymerase primary sigma factor
MKKIIKQKSITNRESNSMNNYLKDISKIPLLTPNEELELAKRIKDFDDQGAIDKLSESNVRFVITVAKQYQNQGLSLPDLINEGNIGLIKAAKRFDYEKGFKFISYAVWWIRQSILQSLAEHSRTIRLPLNQVGNIIKVNRALNKLEQENEREPTPEELSNEVDLKIKNISLTLNLSGKCVSIDEPFKINDIDGGRIGDTIENYNSVSPDNNLMEESITSEINDSMKVLNDREREVVSLFFGLGGEGKMTLESIGLRLGVSRERARQIKEKSIRKLRNGFKGKGL